MATVGTLPIAAQSVTIGIHGGLVVALGEEDFADAVAGEGTL